MHMTMIDEVPKQVRHDVSYRIHCTFIIQMTTTEQLYEHYLQHPVISTDTRKITPGCIFFALKGDKFDANTFAEQAIAEGAAFAVIDNPDYQKGDQYLLVTDVLGTLQDLA